MKAIVCMKYGLSDVLELQEVPKPAPEGDEVLLRVHAASIHIGDWHILRGVPYIMRQVLGAAAVE